MPAAAGAATRERPADVLLGWGQNMKVGRNSGGGRGRVALDRHVVCSEAAGHLAAAGVEVMGAAEELLGLSAHGCKWKGGARRRGLMMFESLGCASSEADRLVKCLNQAVAENTDPPPGKIANGLGK